MLAILAVTFPFFALVLCGYIAVRRHLLPQIAIPGMNSFVLYFALPCLLYRFGAATPLAQLLDPAVAGVYLLCAVIMVGLVVVATLGRTRDWNNAAFGALVAAFPNTGFMGVPLLVALVGARASAPVIVTIAVDLIVTTSLCIALSRLGQGRGHGSAVALGQALSGMLRNPMPWAILLGAAASGAGLVLPAPAMRTVDLLADAASPVALFAIGAVLARSHMHASGPTPLSGYLPVALAKLLLHPLLVFGVGHAAMRAGVPLDPAALTVLILVACLPSAGNVALLTERFGADSGRIARIILVSTAISFLSFSAVVAFAI
ncbi:MAG: AEC family transporter [Pseudomonadota bacterium]